MSIDYNLICDECGRIVDGSKVSSAEVRRQALRQGIIKRVGHKDICLRCICNPNDD